MNALLDAIGAVAVGGMILLSIVAGIYGIQVYSYNTKLQATLTTTSEIASAALQDKYLSALGLVPNSLIATAEMDTMIISATRKTLQFYADIDGSMKTVQISQGTQNADGWYPLTVTLNGVTDYGPFFTSIENIFTFFQANNVSISFASNSIPNGQLKNIRSVRVDLSFVLRGMSKSTGSTKSVMNKIVFWQYFKNLYL